MSEARQKAESGSRGVDSPRRRRSEAEKRRIVAESYRSGESASAVARRHVLYGRRSERKERLLGQLELELDELTARTAEDDLAAETQSERTTEVKAFKRRRASRKPFPEHLPRERVVVPSPASCTCCASKFV